MESPSPEYGTYAARAAYWGDRVCRFCDHHNPAAAKFCNDCGSPLHLKPCNQCDAVNQQAATNCSKCGAEYPPLTGATSALLAADSKAAAGPTTDVDPAATMTQPLIAASSTPARRLLRPGQVVAIATILIVSVYAAYWIAAATPDVIEVDLQPVAANEYDAPAAASVVPLTMDAKPVQLETPSALQAPIASTDPGPPKRASVRQRLAPATKHTSAHPLPQLHPPVGPKPGLAQRPRDEHVGAPVTTLKPEQRDPRQAMHVSLARCGGDLVARVMCDQRVRRRFCEGHWGEAAECARIENDRGQ